MSLITNRPATWNEVVGQERVQKVLAGTFQHPHLMTRGYIFSGIRGNGKTTVAYLYAKALMCLSPDPMQCRSCPSCLQFDPTVLQADFREVDAASHSSVEQAQLLIQFAQQLPQLAKRRVLLIDEAHQLSAQAWDVFMKPLDQHDQHTVFLFPTTEPRAIPATIQSRCTVLALKPLTQDELVGHLVSVADQQKLPYTLGGIRRIAELATGSSRQALNLLQTVALTGPVSVEACQEVLVEDLSATAATLFALLIRSSKSAKEQQVQLVVDCMKRSADAAQMTTPAALIAAMTSYYAHSLFEPGETAKALPGFKAVATTMLRWSRTSHIPVDAISLFIMELAEHLPGQVPALIDPDQRQETGMRVRETSTLVQDASVPSHTPTKQSFDVEAFAQLIGAQG